MESRRDERAAGASDPSRFNEPHKSTAENVEHRRGLERYFAESTGSVVERLENFAKYAPRPRLARFLIRYEIFKQVLDVQGSIVECGVLFGGGLMTWAQVSAILEPSNHQRRIIGFDTFAGFTDMAEADRTSTSAFAEPGALGVDAHDDLLEAMRLYDMGRFLNHIPKVALVRGDASKTIPRYVQEHPHLAVSLLNLDFDLYEPTRIALEQFVPRMPKGAIIVFDELNSPEWPGETQAAMDAVGLRNLRVRRLPMGTSISYAVLD